MKSKIHRPQRRALTPRERKVLALAAADLEPGTARSATGGTKSHNIACGMRPGTRKPALPPTRRPTQREATRIALLFENEQTAAPIRAHFEVAVPRYEVDSYADAAAALDGLACRPPAAVLVELDPLHDRSLDGLRRIGARFPHLPLVALPPADDPEAILLALLVGARGCVTQPAAAEDLLRAVNDVRHGRMALCHKAQARLVHCLWTIAVPAAGGATFARREWQVVVALLQNRTNKEIANSLGISAATVHAHLDRLYKKLTVHSRDALVRKLLRQT